MKRTIMEAVLGSVFGLVLTLAGVQSCMGGPVTRQSDRSIEGTWLTVVTPVNCETGSPVGPSFPGILSFNKGGTMSGTSTVAPSVFGVWSRSGGWENYSFAFTNFRYNASGVYVGSQVVRQAATLEESGNSFVSSGTVAILDTNGVQIGTGCANSAGTRFE